MFLERKSQLASLVGCFGVFKEVCSANKKFIIYTCQQGLSDVSGMLSHQ